ncbi:hypothetical protein [Acinetobacter sp. ANC 3791]|uniref:hypothetical protein n=1 Tax=Acinetobacter sp. ANC 3791 TaxID=2529836 RepID=UPI001038C063|nr:hypothetical protein [Acinetobacter sp. ANC 3791]TCB83117.1 hypothetical protein E0H90_12445 [Acinetobacter sp. ANC 3791]
MIFLENFTSLDVSDLLDFCRQNLLQGIPYVFYQNKENYYKFRKRIAEHWDIHFQDIYITGSASLGFSIVKQTDFSLDSDIDVAIVSQKLFDRIMESIHKYQLKLREFRADLTRDQIKKYHIFLEYSAMGWIRPDLLPINLVEEVNFLKNDWFNFFDSISNNQSEVGNYEVNAGIFKSHYHLEEYTLLGLKKIHNPSYINKEE